jgi:hypothetical protein
MFHSAHSNHKTGYVSFLFRGYLTLMILTKVSHTNIWEV